jgi:hypothetical protein
MNKRPNKDPKWITKMEVKHWRSGKMMKRKDGKPFKFRIN